MSDINHQDLNSQPVPFFARYLEGQFGKELSEAEMAAVSGGAISASTLPPTFKRFLEDEDSKGDAISFDLFQGDPPTSIPPISLPEFPHPGEGEVMTMKYPSDQE
ncbi:MAG: microviridin/marinostatin family tricyclic proteinase inhibitor [Cyanosarcina radialis HA8281-LM2]|jgi:bacteriocin-like protein|nr:microviridin/marinostatin family tricyclic proteinase inhibitor [Cyanosarcina radialis HA8281-LM2]